MNNTGFVTLEGLALALNLPADWLLQEVDDHRLPYLNTNSGKYFDIEQVKVTLGKRMETEVWFSNEQSTRLIIAFKKFLRDYCGLKTEAVNKLYRKIQASHHIYKCGLNSLEDDNGWGKSLRYSKDGESYYVDQLIAVWPELKKRTCDIPDIINRPDLKGGGNETE